MTTTIPFARAVGIALLLLASVQPLLAQTLCVGDCDGDGRVAVHELVLGVNIALERADLSACSGFDADGDQRVMVNELVRGVADALLGCGVPTQTPTLTPSATPSPSPAVSVCGDGVAAGAEECDDGNDEDGDGCTATCTLEPGGDVCTGVPTVSGTNLRTVVFARGLSRPLLITAPRLDPNRVFIVEQTGRIRVVRAGAVLPDSFLNLVDLVSCCVERGLLGLAFHPDFEQNGRFFVNYTNRSGATVIARYHANPSADVADADSGQILLTIEQPFANHNGGHLAFGPDGYLYVGMGDGGSANDPREAGQSDTTLLGKMLRIDVGVEDPPYRAVPPTNPNPAAADPFGLIWAKGLRNPWRFAFDRANGDLYIGDVGQDEIEEIDVQPGTSTGGENYGWDIFEGSACFEPRPLFDQCPAPDAYRFPIVEYTHDDGCSVTGGYVYRGCVLPDLRGTYFYGDYCSSFVRSLVYADGAATEERDWTSALAPGGGLRLGDISSFGEDARGEQYIANLSAGIVFKIVP
jgi:cysteine-rich repeat protein